MPRLVFLVTEDWYFVSHRMALAVAAKDAGFDVTVITRCGAKCEAIRAAGIEVVPFSMERRGLNPLGLAREVIRLARLYRRLQPDIVHHVALRPVVVGGLAARLAGVTRVVSAIAGMGYAFTAGRGGWLAAVLRGLLRLALGRGAVIVQNPEDAAAVARLGMAPARIRLIPGAGVDVARFAPQPEPEGLPVVMLASRLLWDKGVGEFIEAARRLPGRACFVLVGAPDPGNPASVDESTLRAWTEEGVVEWWGPREDMPATLNAAHIVCLPSYREGLPKVLLEAMACGRAVVTTDAPGCRDCVRDGDNGLLVPVGDAGALAAAIRQLLDDPDLRRRMGARGRERAVNEFAQAIVIEATLALYRNAVAAPPRTTGFAAGTGGR
ncbi:glycosyltransferase family 4 protein [Pelomicrobium methylotrophicum]|uniref:Glycosyltransferase family 4 protein n=1 Tax=Pelomicrobium methylotrophicum TaxID=2602750 RepID=A0A5C7ELS7_9PROT|nr:glycosyltransferase family 4 protein [Pelomicrobium methylotrophicum]TXF13339.1 glycosyltransferase family 4 protein [Pelomicrobium methylotrophicum]